MSNKLKHKRNTNTEQQINMSKTKEDDVDFEEDEAEEEEGEEEEEEEEEPTKKKRGKATKSQKQKQKKKRAKYSKKQLIEMETSVALHDKDLAGIIEDMKKADPEMFASHTEGSVEKKIREILQNRERAQRLDALVAVQKRGSSTSESENQTPQVIRKTPLQYSRLEPFSMSSHRVHEGAFTPILIDCGDRVFLLWPFSPQWLSDWKVSCEIDTHCITLNISTPKPTTIELGELFEREFGMAYPLANVPEELLPTADIRVGWEHEKLWDPDSMQLRQSAHFLVMSVRVLPTDLRVYSAPNMPAKIFVSDLLRIQETKEKAIQHTKEELKELAKIQEERVSEKKNQEQGKEKQK